MPSVTGSPFDDGEPVLPLPLPRSSFSAVDPPAPFANRFDVPSIKDLSFPLSLSLSLTSVCSCVSRRSVSFPLPRSFDPSRSLGASKRKVSRDFFFPFLSPAPDGFPSSILLDFGESVFSARDRFSRNGVIKPVVYGQNSFSPNLSEYVDFPGAHARALPSLERRLISRFTNWRYESRVTRMPFSPACKTDIETPKFCFFVVSTDTPCYIIFIVLYERRIYLTRSYWKTLAR